MSNSEFDTEAPRLFNLLTWWGEGERYIDFKKYFFGLSRQFLSMLERNFCSFQAKTLLPWWVVGIRIKANTVQFQLKMPTGTELANTEVQRLTNHKLGCSNQSKTWPIICQL
jgi:hypothetical protein